MSRFIEGFTTRGREELERREEAHQLTEAIFALAPQQTYTRAFTVENLARDITEVHSGRLGILIRSLEFEREDPLNVEITGSSVGIKKGSHEFTFPFDHRTFKPEIPQISVNSITGELNMPALSQTAIFKELFLPFLRVLRENLKNNRLAWEKSLQAEKEDYLIRLEQIEPAATSVILNLMDQWTFDDNFGQEDSDLFVTEPIIESKKGKKEILIPIFTTLPVDEQFASKVDSHNFALGQKTASTYDFSPPAYEARFRGKKPIKIVICRFSENLHYISTYESSFKHFLEDPKAEKLHWPILIPDSKTTHLVHCDPNKRDY